MMKQSSIYLTILLVFIELSVLIAGSPAMLIRCRDLARDTPEGTACEEMPGFITYEGHCYPLADMGMCNEVPGFADFVAMDVVIDGETFTICVPDCSTVSGCSECGGDVTWDPIDQICKCDESGNVFNCGCPDPLVENTVVVSIIDGFGECNLPEQRCYDLGLDITIEPFVCDDPNAALDTIRILIKPAGGGLFNPFDDAVTIGDLINCDLLDGSNELDTLVGIFGGDGTDRLAFVADANGCIELEFTRDPNEETLISFLGNPDDDILIPPCPRVFDPCSCRPENIVDANGIVLFWYDEMTVIGSPNSPVNMQTNNNLPGFLDFGTQSPVTDGTNLGSLDGTGVLTVPFFRTPEEPTDVIIEEVVGTLVSTTDLMSECTLPVNECVGIVPTLGEWAVIILSLLMLITSIVAVRQEEFALHF